MSDHLKGNFVGWFLPNQINRFITVHKLIKSRKMKYISLISNRDRFDQPGTHWWSILDIHPKNAIS